MTIPRIRVGIVGLRADQGWAAVAHLPALRHLNETFEIAGVANSSPGSARSAATVHGIPRAYASAADLAGATDIDLVVVTTRVPQHFEVVATALRARKHVYCEWPLGRTLDEAVELAALARDQGVLAVAGTQARVSPAVRRLRRLIEDGYVGNVVATHVQGYVPTWGPEIADLAGERYLRERHNGATLLSIPLGHTIAAIRDVLGDVTDVSAVLETRYPRVRVAATETVITADAPDHIVVAGRLAGGSPVSIFYAGGRPIDASGFTWEIRGSDGDLRITAPHGYSQIADLVIVGKKRTDASATPIDPEPDPLRCHGLVVGNVARIYQRIAHDLQHDSRTAPTFDDAVALHRVLWAIERSAASGVRVEIDAVNRPLP